MQREITKKIERFDVASHELINEEAFINFDVDMSRSERDWRYTV